MRALVVGYGSIGARHARILDAVGCDVAVVSRRDIDWPRVLPDLQRGLDSQPDYVVIANSTSAHGTSLRTLAASGFSGKVLVEKPLALSPEPLPKHDFSGIWVGYNLRFNPAMMVLKELLRDSEAASVEISAGQYLPQWRPGTDYRQSYSASRAQGGGVLRDLSHELDYALWLFGEWTSVCALGGRMSGLEIDSDDVYSMLVTLRKCKAMSLNLNYLNRTKKRAILVNTPDRTVSVDLVNSTLSVGGTVRSFEVSADDTYRAMHLAVMAGSSEYLCTVPEANEVVDFIAAIEDAATHRQWRYRTK